MQLDRLSFTLLSLSSNGGPHGPEHRHLELLPRQRPKPLARLEEFGPETSVMPESSPNPAVSAVGVLSEAVPHLCTGSLAGKGLGIFGRLDILLMPRAVFGGPRTTCLAPDICLEGCRFSVPGIWTVPLRVTLLPTGYVGAFSGIGNQHADHLADGQAVVAGDTNCSG